MFDLAPFALSEMIAASAALRDADRAAPCMQDAATTIVRYLNEHLLDKSTGEPACVLVRFYKTHPYGDLPRELQQMAGPPLDGETGGACDLSCLVQLASAGLESGRENWRSSLGPPVIPLPTSEALERLPMMSALVAELGLDPSALVCPQVTSTGVVDDRIFNVFHVVDAVGHPSIPYQDDLVVPYGVKSVLGLGGVLPSGAVFAVVLLSTVTVPRHTAELFSPLALAVKVGILPFDDGRIFSDEPPVTAP